MKKMLVLTAATIVLSLVFTGCSGESANEPDTDSETASVSENAESKPMENTAENSTSSFLAGKESDTPESSKNLTKNSSSAATNSTAPKITPSTQATETQAPTATETPAPEQEIAQPPVTVPPKQETVTPPPIETPQETVPPPEPTPPAPPEPPTPDFEVSGYVEQAKNYGQSIGLSLDSTATACWDNPTYASATASNISGNLASLLDWYKNSGFTGFWVWAEDLGNGAFNIYIGYA